MHFLQRANKSTVRFLLMLVKALRNICCPLLDNTKLTHCYLTVNVFIYNVRNYIFSQKPIYHTGNITIKTCFKAQL